MVNIKINTIWLGYYDYDYDEDDDDGDDDDDEEEEEKYVITVMFIAADSCQKLKNSVGCSTLHNALK